MEFRDFRKISGVARIDEPVNPNLGAARMSRRDQIHPWISPAEGFPGFRLAGNIFSTREGLANWFNVNVDDFTDIMMEAMDQPGDPRVIPVPDYYHEVGIDDLPIPTYYSEDGGPYITSGIFHSGFDGRYNLSFHRMMYLGGGRFGVRVVPRHLNALMKEAEKQERELRAVVSIGADPASLLAGSSSADFGVDEFGIASALHMKAEGRPLNLIEPYVDGLRAPAGSEIIMAGKFLNERVPEGPFVDITSTYDRKGMDPGEPVFQVEKVLAREDPIMHVLLPGGLEHYLMMGIPKEPAILRSVRKVVPRVNGVRLTEGGCCWLHGVVSIRKQKEGDAKNAVMAAFSGHPSMKQVVVVDSDIDIFDDLDVEWAVATRYQADRDLVLIKKARGSTLDPSADPTDGTTSKTGLDATVPLGSNGDYDKVSE